VHLPSQSRDRIASCDAAFERATQAWGVAGGRQSSRLEMIRLALRLVLGGVFRMTWCRSLARQDAHARVQGQTGRRNIVFRAPPVLREIP
jgi:hypothetical protein